MHRLPPLLSAATTLGSLASLESHHNKSVGGGDPSDGICTRRRKHRSTEVEKAEVTLSKWRHRLPWPVQSLLGPQRHHSPSSPWASLPRLGASLILPFPKVAQSMLVLLFSNSVHACVFLSLLYVSVLRGGLLVAIWYREIGRGAAHLSAQDPVEVREGAIKLKGPCNSALPLWGQSACLLHLKIKRLLFHLEANVVESTQKPSVFLPVSATQTRPTIRSHQTWFVYQKHG